MAVPTADDWGSWLIDARTQGVVPLLYRLVDEHPTDLSDAQRADLRQVFGATMCRLVQLEHHAIDISERLRAAGIRSVVLKGGASAHLDYDEPTMREFSDVDLLVEPHHLDEAARVIEAAGWSQGYPLPAGHDRFTHAITFVCSGMELDLHQRIARRALGRLVQPVDLLDRSVEFTIAGRTVRALAPDDRLLHAAVHAIGKEPKWSTLSDIVVMMRATDVDPVSFVERIDALGIRTLVDRALIEAHERGSMALPDRWEPALAEPAQQHDRVLERAYASSNPRPIALEFAHLRALDGWRDRWRYTSGFFRGDGRGLGERVRYVASKLRR